VKAALQIVLILALAICLSLVALFIHRRLTVPHSGQVFDEAYQAHRTAESFPAADEDFFHDMDGAIPLTPEEIRGRDTWMVWTAGNDRFWDLMSVGSFGLLDLLKTVSSYDPEKDPSLSADQKHNLTSRYKFSRDNRWTYLGLINEPCFTQARGPDPKHFGLWLDQRITGPNCPPDPFEDPAKYPGVSLGARGGTMPPGSYYGYATGIVGLRLFPNPAFDAAAARKWGDGVRFYTDPSFYESKDLIRPYRVGMACAFCHVSPSPLNPPADPEHPAWANLSSIAGAQTFWTDRIFSWQSDPSNFAFQLFHTYRPGSMDTSLVSADNIDNPRTMNAIYDLGPRLLEATLRGKETLSHANLLNKQFNDYVKSGPLTQFFQPPSTVWTPHILKDAADSVGALAALNRVYLNIGTFSEEWLLHFNPIIGGTKTTPMEMSVVRPHSVYFQATERQTFDMARFLVTAGAPHHLEDAPGHEKYLYEDRATLTQGKIIFAEQCAACHSSKAPDPPADSDPSTCAASEYIACWNRYWAWTKTTGFKTRMRAIALADDFLKDNFLSTDARVPVTLLETNACSALATNGLAGSIWDNFTSQTYKDLPSAGVITYYHPVTGEAKTYTLPGGGRGFTRPASLVSVWAQAPFLLNNSVGPFNPGVSVESRMQSFEASIEQMLWPELREKDQYLGDKVPGKIDRTTSRSYLRVPKGYLPDTLMTLLEPAIKLFPTLFTADGIQIGPIPSGIPVGLFANLDLYPDNLSPAQRVEHDAKLVRVLLQAKHAFQAAENANDEEGRRIFAPLVDPLLELSRCPDLIVNRGHYFGSSLTDADKRALIAFLKTL
jgi:hypothetical protein